MSKAAKLTFCITAILTLGTVAGVHYIQYQEKEVIQDLYYQKSYLR